MPKTSANPDRLLYRAQRYTMHLEAKLSSLSRVLATLETAIKQGAVTPEDPDDISGRLRWVQYKLDHELPTRLGAVRLQASDLMEQLHLICQPEVQSPPQQSQGDQLAIAPFPEDFQQDMDQTFQQAVALCHGPQPVHPQVFSPPQEPPGDQPIPISSP